MNAIADRVTATTSHRLEPKEERNIMATLESTNGHTNGHSSNGNGHSNGNGRAAVPLEVWSCSDKQRSLIVKIVDDHHLDKHHIETLSQERFGKGVRQLNKMEASGLIEELLETHGGNQGGRSHGSRLPKGRAA